MVRPIEIQDNLSKAPFAAREQHLQQSNAQAAQQQVNAEVAEGKVLDQSRPLPLDETDPSQLAIGDRAHPAPSSRPRDRRPLPSTEPESPPSPESPSSSGIDYLA